MFFRFHLKRMENGSAFVAAECMRLSGYGYTFLGLRASFNKTMSIFEFKKM
jgi:hypothetical protein